MGKINISEEMYFFQFLSLFGMNLCLLTFWAETFLKAKKKSCLVPITLPYLVFVPYPKVFFANPTEKWIVPTQKIALSS